MMMSDKGKQAGMIVASMRPNEADDSSEMPEGDHYDMAAQEVIDALDAKDPAALKEALKSFVSMCMDESGPAEDLSSESEQE